MFEGFRPLGAFPRGLRHPDAAWATFSTAGLAMRLSPWDPEHPRAPWRALRHALRQALRRSLQHSLQHSLPRLTTAGALLAGAVGCASGGAATGTTGQGATPMVVSDAPASRRAILTDGAGVTYSAAPPEQSRRIAAPAAAVMTAVRQAYAGFLIPVTLDDRASRRIGNPDFYRSREFMGRRMNELLDCGSGMTGPNAATFRIYLALITRVQDAPGGESEVRVQLSATAKDLTSGSSSDLLPCGSNGRIEQRLLDEIAKRATGGAAP